MNKTINSTKTLTDGNEMPYLGLGTWRARGKECRHAVTFALNHSYSMIDTAQMYENEKQVGDGWKESGQSRDNIFISTKISNQNQGFTQSKEAFKKSLTDLQTDYIDLLMIHWPDIGNFSRTTATWEALIDLQKAGMAKSIGVCNFTIDLIQKLIDESNVIPAVNQVEFHVFLYQKELLEFCNEKHIQIEAYSPIARARFLKNDTLQKIAKKYDKTAAQIMLSWCINHDLVVIPKSVHENRILENADIFFELEKEDMKEMDNIEFEQRLVKGGWSPPSW